jgi:hypothetical protein
MSSPDQQQLYENAATINQWLGSGVPKAIIVKKVGARSHFGESHICHSWPTNVNGLQSQSVEVTHRAYNNSGKPHIPHILLSASAEFQETYSQEPQGGPSNMWLKVTTSYK